MGRSLNGWASRPLALNRPDVLTAHYRAYPVELIATFNKLVTCEEHDQVGDVLLRQDVQDLDFLPVLDHSRIVGLFNRAKYMNGPNIKNSCQISKLMERLSDNNIISSNTGLLTFISDGSPCRLVIRDTRIDGIVTISDLQKLPVRPALFFLTTYVELLMVYVLQEAGLAEEVWFHAISKSRQRKIERKLKILQAMDMDIDKLTTSDFCDKREALVKLINLPVSKSVARNELKAIEEIRNRVAHAGDYAATKEAALRTIDAVRFAEKWIERLESALADFEKENIVA